MMNPLEGRHDDDCVLDCAARAGFRLVQYETDTGQLIWEWRRGGYPGPQFVTRRVAVHWMTEVLGREHHLPIVSCAGL